MIEVLSQAPKVVAIHLTKMVEDNDEVEVPQIKIISSDKCCIVFQIVIIEVAFSRRDS